MNLRKIAIVGVIALGATVLGGCKSKVPISASDGAIAGSAVITFDGTSFSPSSLTIKTGESVTVKNTSSSTVQVNSDPHPTHTFFPDLNVGAISPDSNDSFTVSKVGTYTYHNHLNASQKGTIVVE